MNSKLKETITTNKVEMQGEDSDDEIIIIKKRLIPKVLKKKTKERKNVHTTSVTT